MTARYVVRPQVHSAEFPHDGGWAEWDTIDNRQIGWSKDKGRCEQEAEADNTKEATQ